MSSKKKRAYGRQNTYEYKLAQIVKTIHNANNFYEILPVIESDLLDLLKAERLTIFQTDRNGRSMRSIFKSGDELVEIRVQFTDTSIAGYVALHREPLNIKNVYDPNELARISPEIVFDDSFDRRAEYRTRSMLAVPILSNDVLLGLIQIINRTDGENFTKTDMRNVVEFSDLLGQKFRYDLQATHGPFAHLVNTNRITQEQLEDATEAAPQSERTIAELLMHEYGLKKLEIGTALEKYYQVPFIEYDPDIELPKLLMVGKNEAFFRKNYWLPVEQTKDEAIVLIDDPNDRDKREDVYQLIGVKNYVFRVGLREDILAFLSQSDTEGGETELVEIIETLKGEGSPDSPDQVAESEPAENEATIVKLVNRIISEAYAQKASDIHIEPAQAGKPAEVRFRVDGVCHTALGIPANNIRAVVSRIKVMAGLDLNPHLPQSGKCTLTIKNLPLDLRVETVPTVNGQGAVLRILASSKPLPLDQIRLSTRNFEVTANRIERPHGIFLVVGPTGSGKTTTLHAILGHINTPERVIWTAEDPVEIAQLGLQQVQVRPKAGFTFASALRSFLRADPDVIMIGEMRDPETAEAAIEASLTGHLVFSTLHTNSAAETITRLLDLGVDPVSFSDALLGVLAQRLMRTLCPDCKEAYAATTEEMDNLRRYYGADIFDELNAGAALELYRANGCESCGGLGYRSRIGIHELLANSAAVKPLIYDKAPVSDIHAGAVADGMRTLMQDGIAKIVEGHSDFEQLRRVASE